MIFVHVHVHVYIRTLTQYHCWLIESWMYRYTYHSMWWRSRVHNRSCATHARYDSSLFLDCIVAVFAFSFVRWFRVFSYVTVTNWEKEQKATKKRASKIAYSEYLCIVLLFELYGLIPKREPHATRQYSIHIHFWQYTTENTLIH